MITDSLAFIENYYVITIYIFVCEEKLWVVK